MTTVLPSREEQHQWACGCPLWQSSFEQLPTCVFWTLPMSSPQNLDNKSNTVTKPKKINNMIYIVRLVPFKDLHPRMGNLSYHLCCLIHGLSWGIGMFKKKKNQVNEETDKSKANPPTINTFRLLIRFYHYFFFFFFIRWCFETDPKNQRKLHICNFHIFK